MRSAKRSMNVGHRRRDNLVVPVYWVADKSRPSSGMATKIDRATWHLSKWTCDIGISDIPANTQRKYNVVQRCTTL